MDTQCESHRVGFTIGIGANAVLKRRSDDLMQEAVAQHQATGEKAKLYDHFPHQAGI